MTAFHAVFRACLDQGGRDALRRDRRTIDVCLTGQFVCTHFAVPLLEHSRNAAIVNLSSFAERARGMRFNVAAMAASMGGNVRVGLEDSLWNGQGRLAKSNAEQVALGRQIIEGLGRAVATREIVSLKCG
jgi:uncharacterized protein (DUF849 family)